MARDFGTAPTVDGIKLGHNHNHTDDPALAKFTEALGMRYTKPVDVAFLGDSVLEGVNATNDVSRWVSLLTKYLQRTYNPPNVAGGLGYIPPHSSIYGAGGTYWTLSGGAFQTNTGGWGFRQVGFTAVGHTSTFTFTGDRFWLLYEQGPSHGGISVQIDGGTTTVFGTNNATLKSGRLWDSGLLTRGSHTVIVKANNSLAAPNNIYNAVVDGIMCFDGDGAATAGNGYGVRVWEGGFSGYATSNFTSSVRWAEPLDTIAPDMVVVALGANDMGASVSQATYRTNLESIVSTINSTATTSPSIALLGYGTADTTANKETWRQYCRTMQVAAEANGWAYIDLREVVGTAHTGADNIFYATGHHITDAGSRVYAEGIHRKITGAEVQPARVNDEGPLRSIADSPQDLISTVTLTGYQSGSGVTGLYVSAQTPPTLTLNVTAGQLVFAYGEQSGSAASTVTIATADANFPRWDVVQVGTGGGAPSVVTGVASPFPAVPSASLFNGLLAYVYVPAGATTITDQQIVTAGFAPAPRYLNVKRQGSNLVVTNSTTLANTDLTFPVAPNDTWSFRCYLRVDGPTANDIRLAFTWPTGATAWWGGAGGNASLASTKDGSVLTPITTASATSVTFGTAGAAVTTFIELAGYIANSTTGGSLTLQAAQGTAGAATSATVYAGSWMELIRTT
jgi:lysophospholipase L1-like esterase